MYQVLSSGVGNTGPQEKRKFLHGAEDLSTFTPLQEAGAWATSSLQPGLGEAPRVAARAGAAAVRYGIQRSPVT